jgi:hypothetical protein
MRFLGRCRKNEQAHWRAEVNQFVAGVARAGLGFLRMRIDPVRGTMSSLAFFWSQAMISAHCLSVIEFSFERS